MKRLLPILLIVVGLVCATSVWLAYKGSGGGPLDFKVVGRTNDAVGVSCAVVVISNRASRAFAYTLDVQSLGRDGWEQLAQNLQARSGTAFSAAGWLGGGSNVLVQVAVPEKQTRFYLSYRRVPTSVENLVSWTLGAVGIRSPLSPRRNEMLVYPEGP